MSKKNEPIYKSMKLYAALTNELTNMCYGYGEVPLSSSVPRLICGEKDSLFRIVNSVRNIENSKIAGFILICDGFYTRFRIENGHSVIMQSGAVRFMEHKIIG